MTGPQPNNTDGPIDGPAASSAASRPSPVGAGFGGPGWANSGAPRGATGTPAVPAGRRIHRRDIDAIDDRLSDRDRAILHWVDEHQFLTVRHIEALHFQGVAAESRTRIARRVLARLRDLRLLGTLERRIGGVRAGSQGLVYYLDVAGHRLLHRRSGRSAPRPYEPTARFVSHRLAVADARIAIFDAARQQLLRHETSAVEPQSWRSYTGIGAARRRVKPDLYVETASADDLVHAWFIEIDLGTESVPTLLTKCREYEAYRRSGVEQDRHGAFPVVVWSVTHRDPAKAARRREAFNAAIAADRALPSLLFRIVAPDDLIPVLAGGGRA